MKKLIFLLALVFLLSCEKTDKRSCWTCTTKELVTGISQVNSFCDWTVEDAQKFADENSGLVLIDGLLLQVVTVCNERK